MAGAPAPFVMPAKQPNSAGAKRAPQKNSRPASAPESKAIIELRQEVTELRTEVHWLKAQLAARQETPATAESTVTDLPESIAPDLDLDLLQSELMAASETRAESDWDLPEDAEESGKDEEWQGANATDSIEYEVLQFNTAHPVDGADPGSQSVPASAAEAPLEVGVGLAMDDHEIAALIAEAEALAKAEIKAETESDFVSEAEMESGTPAALEEGGQSIIESERQEAAISTEFLTGAPAAGGGMSSESLKVPAAEILATVPRRLAIEALACPQLDRDGNLVFLVATPVDEIALNALESQMGRPAKLVHAKVPAVIKAFRETFPEGESKGSPVATGWTRIVNIFRRAA